MNAAEYFDNVEDKEYIETLNKAKKFKAFLEQEYILHYILGVNEAPDNDPLVKDSRELLKTLRKFIHTLEQMICW